MSWLDKPTYRDAEGSQEPIEDPIEWHEGSLEMVPRGLGSAGLAFGELTGTITASTLEAFGDDDAKEYWDKVEQRKKWREQLGENRRGFLPNIGTELVKWGSLVLTDPIVAVSTMFTTEATDEIKKGRTLSEANTLAAIRAGSLYAGVKMPAALAPKYGLSATLGYGSAANIGLGMTSRALEGEAIGDEATPTLDPTALILDAVLGAGFGAREHWVNRKLIDAALDARTTTKAQDSAPGIPTNGEQLDMHMQAVADATKATETGIDPDYSRLDIGDVDPRMAARMNNIIKSIDELSPLEREPIPESPFTLEGYKKLKSTDDGRIINADEARYLDAEFAAGKKAARVIHEEASKLADEAFADRLKTVREGKLPIAEFTAGGAGSGKTTALANAGVDTSKANLIYDATLKTAKNAIAKIEQALSAGHDVNVRYILADPEAAWSRALIRAQEQGREVPIEVFEQTHKGSLETIKKLALKYKDRPDVEIKAYDNRGKAEDIREIPLEELADIAYSTNRQKLEGIANELYKQGKISDTIYRRSVGDAPPSRGVSKQSEQGVPGRAEEGLPGVREEIPDEITVVTQDGESVTGAEYSKQLEAETKQIDDIIGKIQSVTECLLRNANV